MSTSPRPSVLMLQRVAAAAGGGMAAGVVVFVLAQWGFRRASSEDWRLFASVALAVAAALAFGLGYLWPGIARHPSEVSWRRLVMFPLAAG